MWWVAAAAGGLALLAALVWLLLVALGASKVGKHLSKLTDHPALSALGGLPAAIAPLAHVSDKLRLVQRSVARLSAETVAIAIAYARTVSAFRELSSLWEKLLRNIAFEGSTTSSG